MSKLTSLAQAVGTTVKPVATVLFAFTHNRPHAAAFEVARQFRDQRRLTLAATGLLEYASILSAAGAIERIESAFAGGTYPAPAPSRQLQLEIARSAESASTLRLSRTKLVVADRSERRRLRTTVESVAQRYGRRADRVLSMPRVLQPILQLPLSSLYK